MSEYKHGKRRNFVTKLPRIARTPGKPSLGFFEGDLQHGDIDSAVIPPRQHPPSAEVKTASAGNRPRLLGYP